VLHKRSLDLDPVRIPFVQIDYHVVVATKMARSALLDRRVNHPYTVRQGCTTVVHYTLRYSRLV